MKKEMKRFVAGTLAALMLATTNTGFAAEFSDVKEEDYSIVDRVVAAKVMIGTDKGFEPNNELTRAESIAIMVRLKGVSEETVKQSMGRTNYSDVPADHWATGYINVGTSLGLVQGVGDGKFAPEAKVSYAETATMLIRALGGGHVAELDGTWPSNYMKFAIDEGITDGVYKATLATVNRIETAKMVTNTLTAPMWVKSGASTNGSLDYSKDEKKTILSESLDLKEKENLTLNAIDNDDRTVTVDNKEYDLKEGVRVTVEEGMKVDIWLDKNDNVVYIGKAEDSEQKIINFTGIKSSQITENNANDDKLTVYVDGKEKEYNLIDQASGDTQVVINGVANKTLDDLKAAINNADKRDNSTGKLIMENNKVKQIMLNQYDEVMVVEKVVDKKIYNDSDIVSHNNEDLDGKNYIIVDQKGKMMDISEIKKGDTIHFAKEAGTYRMMVLRNNTEEGKITAKANTGKYIKLDGKKYDINMLVNPDIEDLKTEVKIYLDNNGKIIACDEIESDLSTDLGIITEVAGINNTRGEIGAEAVITLLDGTKLEMKELNIEEMEKKFNNNDLFNDTSVTEINKQLYVGGDASDLLGQMVRFKVTDGKYEIKEFENNFKAYDGSSFTSLTKYSSDSKDDIINISGYKIDKDEKKLTKSGSASYRVNANTVVILEDNNTGNDYETQVKIVDFDSLKDNSNISMTLAKVDEDTNYVKYIYIREDQNVARVTNDNYGIIKDVAETNEDGVYSFTILSNNGEVDLTIDDGTDYDETYVGQLVSYTTKDDEITAIEFRGATTSVLEEAKISKFNNGTIKLSRAANDEQLEVLDASDKLVFISADSITKSGSNYILNDLKIGSESDIETMSSSETFKTADNTSTKVYYALVDTDGDGSFDDEIGFIFYVRD